MIGDRTKNLEGAQFGSLRVVEHFGGGGGGSAVWLCKCSCGGSEILLGKRLTSGSVQACRKCAPPAPRKPAKRVNKVAGLSSRPLYNLWAGIRARTLNDRSAGYPDYGARGIKMHEPWAEDYLAFESYVLSELGPKPQGKSLDRVDNDGHYVPGNLRWATSKEQVANQRVPKTAAFVICEGVPTRKAEAARKLGVSPATVSIWVKTGKLKACPRPSPDERKPDEQTHR